MKISRISTALVAAALALTVMPLQGNAATTAHGECNGTGTKNIVGGHAARIPARDGSWSCWLDQSPEYSAAALQLQYSIRYAEGIAIDVDGYYGPGTKSAVRTIQYRRGTTPDGEYGPNTGWVMRWKAINGKVGKWG